MEKAVVCPRQEGRAKIFPVGLDRVKLKGFLNRKIEVNRKFSIPSLYRLFLRSGTVNNFKVVCGKRKGDIVRRLATDSDLYKWMEAVSYDLLNEENRQREQLLEDLISLVSEAQEKSGYIDTFYSGGERKNRFKYLSCSHELYCGGHLIQAAIAHYRSTGRENFLKVALKWADFVSEKFGPGKIEENDGHPEVEMALVELFRVTGKEKYLQLAEFFLSQPYKLLGGYPFLKFPGVIGHAVRMIYLCCGATDYCTETGEETYLE
ncbi:MAG: glycoside hydrolase family 127 protein, partial [Candidatus Omnitrophica bacterium]|nr:glycoside hydrolase family 127 protein [Candidatus Omnitrophota bacterium]